jgi:acetolactate synthase-1/2/3 large subunit
MLLEAKRPMIYAGGGVILSDAAERLVKLARTLGYPVTNTLMGLGGYPATDKQNLGMLGMHGTYEANMAMQNCDVLIAVGARFDDRGIGNPAHFGSVARRIIHIDIDPSSISKRVKVDVPIVGNLPDVLDELQKLLESSEGRPDQKALAAWWKQIDEWRGKKSLKYKQGKEIIMPQYVVEKLYEVTGGDAFVTSDVASIRCGQRNTTSLTNRGAGSTRAVWGPWASVCPTQWVCALPIRRQPWLALRVKRRSR